MAFLNFDVLQKYTNSTSQDPRFTPPKNCGLHTGLLCIYLQLQQQLLIAGSSFSVHTTQARETLYLRSEEWRNVITIFEIILGNLG